MSTKSYPCSAREWCPMWDLLPHGQLLQSTELPDSLDDAAEIAAMACAQFAEAQGCHAARCRVDFDTSVGDETYTLLKSSTEFMQKFTTALCYAMIPRIQEMRMEEMKRVAQAKAMLRQLGPTSSSSTNEETENDDDINRQRQECVQILQNQGREPSAATQPYQGPVARIYFPDEGSAALARRDWAGGNSKNSINPLVPSCVAFSSCGGIQGQDITNDEVVFFFCPKASESDAVERILKQTEEKAANLKLTVFVNPNLVDMGVTGFGMAGRLLRERLIDPLVPTYYLRTLSWGALTRQWPKGFSVWQEDENSNGGYRLIANLDRLPSNPEVEDLYDLENNLAVGKGLNGGFLDQLGDFVSGMMKL